MIHLRKWFVLWLLALTHPGSLWAEDEYLSTWPPVFRDPRAYHGFTRGIRNGERVNENWSMSHAILLFEWCPAPDGQQHVFQISGIQGYYKKRHVAAFLREFYQLSAAQKEAEKSSFPLENIIAASNNWGSYTGLESMLLKLSAQYKFSVYFVGGSAYQRATLMKETPQRLALIKEAFRRATAGEENPALNPQRRLLDALPQLPVTLEFRPLAPVPPGSRITSARLGNVWFTRPYSSFWGTSTEWSMGWGTRAPTPNDGLAFWLTFSRGPIKGDAFGEVLEFTEGELESLYVSGAVIDDPPFLPDFLADRVSLDANLTRRLGESEETFITRIIWDLKTEAAFHHDPAPAGECIRAFETILREILTLSRK